MLGVFVEGEHATIVDNNADEAAYMPTAADLAATASQLESIITDGEPERAKALLRVLIAELRVNGRHDVQPTYCVITSDHAITAGGCATSGKVETIGREAAKP